MYTLGCWIWGTTVRELGIERVLKLSKDIGIKDLFLLVKSVSGIVNFSILESIGKHAIDHDLRIHTWIVCFEDKSVGSITPEDEEYRKYLLTIIEDAVTHEYVYGVHLDYVRYKGNAYDKWVYVSSFVKEVRDLVKSYSQNIVLSIASKAEDYSSKEALLRSALFYGQNYLDLAKYVDLFIPMTYYLDYGIEPRDAVKGALWVKQVTNRSVYIGVQLHPSENPLDRGRIPRVDEIKTQLIESRARGLDGACFFRFRHLFDRVEELKPIIKEVRS